MVTNPLSILWKGRCTIWEYENVIDPDTHQTTQQQVIVIEDEPCRISFSSEATTNPSTGVAEMIQFTMLFIRPDLTIDAGSVIEVTQNGRTTRYRRSCKPAVYTNHQEIKLTLYEDYA
jgi:hypothetical protein